MGGGRLELFRTRSCEFIDRPPNIAQEEKFFRTGCFQLSRANVAGRRRALPRGSMNPSGKLPPSRALSAIQCGESSLPGGFIKAPRELAVPWRTRQPGPSKVPGALCKLLKFLPLPKTERIQKALPSQKPKGDKIYKNFFPNPHTKHKKTKIFKDRKWCIKRELKQVPTHFKNVFSFFTFLWVGSLLFVFSPNIGQNRIPLGDFIKLSKPFSPRGFHKTVIIQNISFFDVL